MSFYYLHKVVHQEQHVALVDAGTRGVSQAFRAWCPGDPPSGYGQVLQELLAEGEAMLSQGEAKGSASLRSAVGCRRWTRA